MLQSFNSITLLFLSLTSISGCRNLYSDFSHKTSTDYLLYEAKKDINNLRFNRAIRNLNEVLSRSPLSKSGNYLYSLAHAGRADLRVANIFQSMLDGAGSLFVISSESFNVSTDDDLLDFATAVSALETIAPTPQDRDQEENFYALFLYFGRIGAVLNRYAYSDTNTLLTANFSGCHKVSNKAAVKTGIPDDQVDVIMTMLPRVMDTVDRLAEQGVSSLPDVSALAAFANFSYDPIPCSANSNNASCLSVRSIINNNATGVGLGTGVGGEAIACAVTTP